MSTGRRVWVAKTDGGCPQPNGPGSFAFVLDADGNIVTRSGFLPTATNNQAEYRAMHAALHFVNDLLLETGADLWPDEVQFWSDSQLIVRQLNGLYRVSQGDLLRFYAEANEALIKLRQKVKVVIDWFQRENNTHADALCNEALERRGIKIVSKKKVAALSLK
jgi:ribonuclease HI